MPIVSHKLSCRAVLFSLGLLLCGATLAFAHPMGNFSINHYSRIKFTQDSVEVLYIVDRAEIPTYQELNQAGFDRNADPAKIGDYLSLQQALLKAGLSLSSDQGPIPLKTVSQRANFADGAGGLPTLKTEFVFRGKLAGGAGTRQIKYADNNFPGRAGWKEIVVTGQGILSSSAPASDRSHELSNYSSDLLNSPPQDLSASVSYQLEEIAPPAAVTARSHRTLVARDSLSLAVAALRTHNPPKSAPLLTLNTTQPNDPTGSGSIALPSSAATATNLVPPSNTPRSRFTQLITTQGKLSLWILLSAALISASLGALHALEPGHGKTIVAAYLVGSRGTAAHAVLLGVVVTAAHTAGVFLLGAITLFASRYVVPEHLYPWLGAVSGVSVAAIGVLMLLRYVTGESGDHTHSPGVQHSHWFLSRLTSSGRDRSADSGATQPQPERPLSLRELCILGITGGIVPCPAALVVLLSAFSLHRIGFGLFLITAFSLGLATVLVVIGLTMVYAKRVMASRLQSGSRAARYLPILSFAFMVILGTAITISALSAVSAANILTKEKLLPFVTVILLGLFLGMRHSTDADHVVAVSTIVSRQGSIRGSAAIGLLWGLGHTITIFIVGAAIIIFGVVIPPRLGLSMEFCVALMLILLGVLNLTGALRWITEHFTPHQPVAESLPVVVHASSQFQPKSRMKTLAGLGIYQTLRPLVIGLVHGLAGSAAVALLVLSTIKSPFWATAYLLVFGFGTMVGMMLMTAAISVPLVFSGRKFFNLNRHLATTSGVISVAFGLFLVYHIGITDGLFAAHPHWIPQ